MIFSRLDYVKAKNDGIPTILIETNTFKDWIKTKAQSVQKWVKVNDFTAEPGSYLIIPDHTGSPSMVFVGCSAPVSLWDLAAASNNLPEGRYNLQGHFSNDDLNKLALGWLLGGYAFSANKKQEEKKTILCLSKKFAINDCRLMAEVIANIRDRISMPAENMGPEDLARATLSLSKKYNAKTSQIIGEKLIQKNYPAIHRVGRASTRQPRLIDLTWGNSHHPKITLIGKGVCFDTGGLDIKPSSSMFLMRKDMAGAAVALGVAQLIMARKIPVRLRLLIPAVDNAIDGSALRPSDVIIMRNGLSVEVGNTDTEGRLILADVLSGAAKEKPDLLIDFSTLTGAARTAVGTDISAFFCPDDSLANSLFELSDQVEDPFWRLPLHPPYGKMLKTPFADLNSCPSSGYAGAITAALFLQRFIDKTSSWVHVDFMGWNLKSLPGRPEGGEAMALRTTIKLIEKKYPTS